MALIANIHRDPESRPEPFTVAEFLGETKPRRKKRRKSQARAEAFFRGLVSDGLAREIKNDE